jgi:hypothetical protein
VQTIQAHVSARILNKADRLFTNRLSQVFVELLQNARRAGASVVSVTATPGAAAGTTRITFTDNGSGIDDFNKLLYLGESGWGEAVERAEDPAGMGLFALLHSGVTVSSRGKTAIIATEAFLGKEPVQVRDQDTPDPEKGTTLVFHREETETGIKEALQRVVRYGPVDVLFNGVVLGRQDFLAGAVHIKEVDGVRIGVFLGDSAPWETLNFHGNVIRINLSERDLGKVVLSPSHNTPLNITARVDIVSATSLHLKLPDRTDLVYDQAFNVLRRQVRKTLLEYLATVDEHIAPFQVYKEALELGIFLKPAVPYLQPFFVSAQDSNSGLEPFDGDQCTYQARVYEAAECALVTLDNDTSEPASFTFDLGSRDRQLPGGLVPVRMERAFDGYAWYDSMARCHNFKLTIDGKPAEDATPISDLTVVDSIQLSFDLERSGAVPEQIEWDLPFAGWSQDSQDEAILFITRDSEWAKTGSPFQPFSLIDAAQHLAFNPSDDCEADSVETQQEYFWRGYEKSLVDTLGGSLAAARLALSRALDWDLTTALDRASLSEVRLVRKENGKWEAEIPDAIQNPT